MSERTIEVPGPDHPITFERDPHRVVTTAGCRTIADTTDAQSVPAS